MAETRQLLNFVDGDFQSAQSGETLDIVNPSTGEVYATSPLSGDADVDVAFRAAQQAFDGAWRDTTPGERMGYLLKIADAIEADADGSSESRARTPASRGRSRCPRGDPADARPDPVLCRSGADARGPVER